MKKPRQFPGGVSQPKQKVRLFAPAPASGARARVVELTGSLLREPINCSIRDHLTAAAQFGLLECGTRDVKVMRIYPPAGGCPVKASDVHTIQRCGR